MDIEFPQLSIYYFTYHVMNVTYINWHSVSSIALKFFILRKVVFTLRAKVFSSFSERKCREMATRGSRGCVI